VHSSRPELARQQLDANKELGNNLTRTLRRIRKAKIANNMKQPKTNIATVLPLWLQTLNRCATSKRTETKEDQCGLRTRNRSDTCDRRNRIRKEVRRENACDIKTEGPHAFANGVFTGLLDARRGGNAEQEHPPVPWTVIKKPTDSAF
jgi:hypothetical protein